nr:photosystem I polypeptide M [Rhipidosiphon lewmanomontiae]
MFITESQIFIALFIALINGFLALRLGSSLYIN